jgi:hypothetical protein
VTRPHSYADSDTCRRTLSKEYVVHVFLGFELTRPNKRGVSVPDSAVYCVVCMEFVARFRVIEGEEEKEKERKREREKKREREREKRRERE